MMWIDFALMLVVPYLTVMGNGARHSNGNGARPR